MLTDTSNSPYAVMSCLPAKGCTITGPGPVARLRARTVEVTVPTMGKIMFDSSIAHAYENFLVAAGDFAGEHHGPPFMDGDLYKWLESATVAAAESPDTDLADYLTKAAIAIERAQQPDGYLHTKTTIAQRAGSDVLPLDERLNFETYNLGHLMNLACVHYRLTGDNSYLKVAERAAGYLIGLTIDHPERLADCNICPSHYMGSIELYRTTGDARYLELAGKLLDLHGGKGSDGSDDNQDVLPVREQRQAVGHSVRANYLYAGMADYALETGDQELITALQSIWDDLVGSKLYITGGCGALYDGASPDAGQNYWAITRVHQAYGRPYQLPNVTAYNESCASLGLIFWAWRMLTLTGDARYADEIERVIYNALPAMIGADGTSYFYTNPLRQVRDLPFPLRRAGNPKDSVPPPSHERGRQEYMTACFCCPPNIARVITELPYYAYSHKDRTAWVHQFVTGTATTDFDGVAVTVRQETDYPATGIIRLGVQAERPVDGQLRVRIPGWSKDAQVSVDGRPVDRFESGYAVLDQQWDHNTVEISLDLSVRLTVAHRFLEEATNQVSVVRGPVVYCVESADLPDDVTVGSVAIPQTIDWTEEPGDGIFGGHVLLRGTAARLPDPVPDGRLYAELDPSPPTPLDLRLIPYALWGNRGSGEMSVWLPLLR
ncbi:glycoside hydrolase family 127 protein [Microlunatus elymi]|nr:beta-L-arabinofuranosidase domain-containing protein [Microlunatus elymi]